MSAPYIPPSAEELERWSAIEARATPGPWEFRLGESREGDSIDVLMAEVPPPGAPDEDPEYSPVFDDGLLGEEAVSANWELTEVARNNLPRLIREVRRLREVCKQEALNVYELRHTEDWDEVREYGQSASARLRAVAEGRA